MGEYGRGGMSAASGRKTMSNLGMFNKSLVRRTVLGYPKPRGEPTVHMVSSHRGTADSSPDFCKAKAGQPGFKHFGDSQTRIAGTFYKSYDLSKGGNLGGGTWWDDSRDQPIFQDTTTVFQID